MRRLNIKDGAKYNTSGKSIRTDTLNTANEKEGKLWQNDKHDSYTGLYAEEVRGVLSPPPSPPPPNTPLLSELFKNLAVFH